MDFVQLDILEKYNIIQKVKLQNFIPEKRVLRSSLALS